MWRPRAGMQSRHSGGVGAPPVPITRPCQELADDPLAYTKRDPHNVDFRPFGKAGHLGRKRGPPLSNRRVGAPRGARAVLARIAMP